MKKLFLTVALVGGMLSFAAKDSAKPVMAENRASDCINWAFEYEEWLAGQGISIGYDTFNALVTSCEAM